MVISNVVKSQREMEFDVQNNAGVAMFLTAMKARGTALQSSDNTWVQAKDSASITDYDEREYTVPAEFLPDTQQATDYCRYIVGLFKDPIAAFPVEFVANQSKLAMDAALVVNVSDRVQLVADNVTGEGVNRPMFLERWQMSIDRGGILNMRWSLSDAEQGFGKWTILDFGPNIDTGFIGY